MDVVLCSGVALASLCLLAAGGVTVILGERVDRASGFKAIGLGLIGLGVFFLGAVIGGMPL